MAAETPIFHFDTQLVVKIPIIGLYLAPSTNAIAAQNQELTALGCSTDYHVSSF
jgi:hypothetical protein